MSPTLEEFRRWLQGEDVEADGLPPSPKPAAKSVRKITSRTRRLLGGQRFDPTKASGRRVELDRPYLHAAELASILFTFPDSALAAEDRDGRRAMEQLEELAKSKGIKWDDVARVERDYDPLRRETQFVVWYVVEVVEASAEGLDDEFELDFGEPGRRPPDMSKLRREKGESRKKVFGRGKYTISDDGNDALLGFGKHSGKTLSEVKAEDPSYLTWILNEDFDENFKELVEEVLTRPSDATFVPSTY